MSKRKPNTLRIVGGQWRRRLLSFPNIPGLRPTPDRIRETLFNWLQPYVGGASCLDLFAGSGALGFEALSRGAKQVSFVDSHPEVIANLKKTSQEFEVDSLQMEIILGRCLEQELLLKKAPYQIVFLDPPYDNEQLPEIVLWLDSHGYLAEDALVYVEMKKKREPLKFVGWTRFKEGHTKNIDYFLYRRDRTE